MAVELARTFLIENEWYWRITENATSFTAGAAVRDFLVPLAQVGKDRFELADMVADDDDRGLAFRIGTQTMHVTHIRLGTGGDRAVVNNFVGDVNRALAIAEVGFALALIVPRRYELRGALFTEDELAALLGDPILLVPTTRASWRSIPS
jgi:hypothetical protein